MRLIACQLNRALITCAESFVLLNAASFLSVSYPNGKFLGGYREGQVSKGFQDSRLTFVLRPGAHYANGTEVRKRGARLFSSPSLSLNTSCGARRGKQTLCYLVRSLSPSFAE